MTTKTHDFLIDNGLTTTITTPTRYNHTTGTYTLIDPTLTTCTDVQITAGTISPPITDHLPTITIFHTHVPRSVRDTQKTLTTARYNRNKDTIIPDIHTALTQLPLQNTHVTTSQHFLDIQTTIQHTIEKHERRPKPRKPWATTQMKRYIKHQHKLHTAMKNNPTPETIKRHKNYRNRLKKKIRRAKRQTLKARLEETRDDPKQQAKILKSVLPAKNGARTSPTTLNYENSTFTDPVDIANALNDHYITIGQKTSNTIPNGQDDYIENDDEHDTTTTNPPFTLHHVTEPEVTKVLQAINSNKASDIFKIKPAIIKDLAPFLTPILTTLFNNSIDENEYPDALKYTKAIEVYKAKDKTLPVNYRPISLLPIIAKVLDTLLNNQLMTHLTNNNIISPTQYAFRPNSSTTLALQSIINRLHHNSHQHNPTLAIYVDLSKAYDTISHRKLINKLRTEFNFTPGTLKFFESYFHNRQQSLHTQHAQSSTQTITHGIPQGSTLSTTFFLLYINNIIQTVPQSKVYTYADDTTLLITAGSVAELQLLAQSELTNLISYFHSNNLVPNPTKTNYTIFHPSSAHDQIHLHIGSTTLKHNTQAKLLGLIIQHNLHHAQTITNTIKKLYTHVQSLRRATQLLPRQDMIQLYYMHIYPHLIQGITIWGSTFTTHLDPIIKIQKKIIRIIMNRPPRSHTQPLMHQHKILNITNLYIQRVCLDMHRFIHPQELKNRPEHDHTYTLVSDIHDHHTRYSHQQHRFMPHAPNPRSPAQPTHHIEHLTALYTAVWNKLPQRLKTTANYNAFKLELKNYLVDKQATEN